MNTLIWRSEQANIKGNGMSQRGDLDVEVQKLMAFEALKKVIKINR